MPLDQTVLAFQNYSQEIPWTGPVSGAEYDVPFGQWEHVHRDDVVEIRKIHADYLPTTYF